MKNIWLKMTFGLIVVVGIIMAFHYKETHKNMPLSEIFPEEQNYPVEIEYATDEAAPKTTTQNVSAVSIPKQAALPKVANSEQLKISVPLADASSKTMPQFAAETATGKFAIQIASYKDKAKAEQFAEGLKKKNWDAYVLAKELKDQGTVYRVYVGRFDSKVNADETLVQVKQDYVSSFVINLK